ncbi:MAG: hypothetical protein JSU85_16505 [Candidatus Zixiibacteriota bacterium]|nr:MAG: hypothetical protein JSU85_16505 [candidate division Zixibacteria bacterium]
MDDPDLKIIDMHMHVGLLGDQWPDWGHFSDWYRRQIVYKLFLFYSRIDEKKVSDLYLRDMTIKTIDSCSLNKVVCLALDPVYDTTGRRRTDLSNVWVDNDFIVKELKKILPEKVLLGASVHPYDPQFLDRIKKYVDEEAVLIKWLPSAQMIDLAEEKTRDAMLSLATIGHNGKPLPLLLHIGPEFAIPTTDQRTGSYDYLTWSWSDKLINSMRGRKRWHRPKTHKIHENLKAGLDEGLIIIFAHAGLPYFSSGIPGRFLEHSDFETVEKYLDLTKKGVFKGKCYTDISAFCTPFRYKFFSKVKKLPPELLLFGSDFPTPAFELSADLNELINDFKAVLKGQLYRIVVPEDNLLDVNYRELEKAFPGHPMFTNFSKLI